MGNPSITTKPPGSKPPTMRKLNICTVPALVVRWLIPSHQTNQREAEFVGHFFVEVSGLRPKCPWGNAESKAYGYGNLSFAHHMVRFWSFPFADQATHFGVTNYLDHRGRMVLRVTFFVHPQVTVVPFYPFLGEGSPTTIDYRKRGTLILTSLLQDQTPFWEKLPPLKLISGQGCHWLRLLFERSVLLLWAKNCTQEAL